MGKTIFEAFDGIQELHEKNSKAHCYIQDILERSLSESSQFPDKILVEVSLFEEIATMFTSLIKNDNKLARLIRTIPQYLKSFSKILSPLRSIKQDLQTLKFEVRDETEKIQKVVKQVVCVNKEFKERCQGTFLDYLKGVDIDLRRILKPLVPSAVLKDQIHYPLMTTMSSLRSSNNSVAEQVNNEDPQAESHPEPKEDIIEKLNSHIQMLIGTLEKVAKDLIQVLTETNREYYLALGMQDKFSRPPTPMAAPLPDYFCYEIEETPREIHQKQVISAETKATWVKRLKKLRKSHNIQESLYSSLSRKLAKPDSKKVDLKELFINENVPVSQRESIVYYLINGTTEFDKHVSLSDIMSEKKITPEPPKQPKPKNKYFFKAEKETDRRFSPDIEVSRISNNFLNQPRVTHSIRLISKSPKVDKIFNKRKSIRVRSTTPVNKDKVPGTRIPSTQKSLNHFYAKHRIRKVM